MSTLTNNLNHSTWECKYHVVFTPKYRKKAIFGLIRKDLKDVLHRLAKHKQCVIEEGYFVSTVGADEKVIRSYIQNQESEDKRIDQLSLFNRNK